MSGAGRTTRRFAVTTLLLAAAVPMGCGGGGMASDGGAGRGGSAGAVAGSSGGGGSGDATGGGGVSGGGIGSGGRGGGAAGTGGGTAGGGGGRGGTGGGTAGGGGAASGGRGGTGGGTAGTGGGTAGGRGGAGGGTAGSGAGGVAGTGGTVDPGPGAICADGGAGDAATPAPVFGAPGQPCPSPGLLACAGANQRQALLCNAGAWQVLATCDADQRCDRTSGVCAAVAVGCEGRDPGFRFCRNDETLVNCGPDLVTTSVAPCCGLCRSGTCEAPRCGNGRREGTEACDDGNTTAADGCETDCRSTEVLQVVAGRAHTCALLTGGNVRCWGANDKGQLGLGIATDLGAQRPQQNGLVGLEAAAVEIAAGSDHTCARLGGGALRCWGNNNRGQLGLGHANPIGDNELPGASAATVNLGGAVRSIAAGGDDTCAILQDGALRCWGRNDFGQLGLGHTRDIGDNELPSPANTTVSLGGQAAMVGVGGNHSCAVLSTGFLGRCWGLNGLGQLGLGIVANVGDDELPDAVDPIVFPEDAAIVALAVNASRACALRADGTEFCWGDSSDGGLGINVVGSDPYRKATDWGLFRWPARALSIAAGSYHSCAALANSHLRCWGQNDKAQLGLANTLTVGDDESAVHVPPIDLGIGADGFPSYAEAIAPGARHTCALLGDGQVRCWGANESGQLGLGFKSAAPMDFVGGTPSTLPGSLPIVRVF